MLRLKKPLSSVISIKLTKEHHLVAHELYLTCPAFEQALSSSSEDPPPALAKMVMVCMVRGFFTKLQFVCAQSPCSQVSGSMQALQLVLGGCKNCGLKVHMSGRLCTLLKLRLYPFCARFLEQHWTVVLSTVGSSSCTT